MSQADYIRVTRLEERCNAFEMRLRLLETRLRTPQERMAHARAARKRIPQEEVAETEVS